jgi:hypothetical protein
MVCRVIHKYTHALQRIFQLCNTFYSVLVFTYRRTPFNLPLSTFLEFVLLDYTLELSLSTIYTPHSGLSSTLFTMESSSPPVKRQRQNTSLPSAYGTTLKMFDIFYVLLLTSLLPNT